VEATMVNQFQPLQVPNWWNIQFTTENLPNNEPFGDIMSEREDGTFRIWGNNFNVLSIDKSGGDFIELCNKVATM
jgi:hypothetical protein